MSAGSDDLRLANVRPAAWTNPVPAGRYDLVVIGAGTAGLVSAAGAAGLGARVALVEKHLMGGDCLNVGCVPSKALIRSARAAAELRDAATLGLRSGDVPPDFAAVMERMRRLRARISANDSAARFKGLGVDVYFGTARFVGRDAVDVDGRTLRFRRAVITTGGRAAVPDVSGLREAGYLTNETVFDLVELPRRLLVVGGGPVGCELAQAFQRLGSAVTLVHRHGHLLEREDRDAAGVVQASLARDGVALELDAEPVRVVSGAPHRVELRGGRMIEVDAILVAAGRAPNVEGLGLEAADVEADPRTGIRVDDRLRTSNRAVFAAGDCCMAAKFTHAADFAARLVIRNALFGGRGRLSSLRIPWCTYTDPELARVGLSQREAAERGIRVDVFVRPLTEVDRAVVDSQDEGFVKVLVRRGSDRIEGVTIVAAHAGDLIGEAAVAMAAGLGLKRLADVIHPYPTQAEALRQVGDMYNRTRLTPLTRRLLRAWFAVRR